jgi:hypothetical protein
MPSITLVLILLAFGTMVLACPRQFLLWERLLFAALVFAALGCLVGGCDKREFFAFWVEPEALREAAPTTLTIETGVYPSFGEFRAYGGIPPEALGPAQVFDTGWVDALKNPGIEPSKLGVKLPTVEEHTKEHLWREMVVKVPANMHSGLVVVEVVNPREGKRSDRWLFTNTRSGYLEVWR